MAEPYEVLTKGQQVKGSTKNATRRKRIDKRRGAVGEIGSGSHLLEIPILKRDPWRVKVRQVNGWKEREGDARRYMNFLQEAEQKGGKNQ